MKLYRNDSSYTNRALHFSKCSYQLRDLTLKKQFLHLSANCGLEKLSIMLVTQLIGEVESRFEPMRVSLIYILWCWASSLILVMLSWPWFSKYIIKPVARIATSVSSLSIVMTFTNFPLILTGSGCSSVSQRNRLTFLHLCQQFSCYSFRMPFSKCLDVAHACPIQLSELIQMVPLL